MDKEIIIAIIAAAILILGLILCLIIVFKKKSSKRIIIDKLFIDNLLVALGTINNIEEVKVDNGRLKFLVSDLDIINNIGKYVYVKTYEKVDGIKEVYGDLISYENGEVTINYLVKTIRKQIKIQKDKISKIRLAVRF